MNNGISRLFKLQIDSSNFEQKVAQPNSVETPGTAGPQDRKLQLPGFFVVILFTFIYMKSLHCKFVAYQC